MENRKLNRLPYLLTTFTIMIVVLVGMTKLYVNSTSFNSLSENKDATYDLLEAHKPEIHWLKPNDKVMGEINKYLVQKLEKDYLEAWGILNLSLKSQKDKGLKENFTEPMTNKINETNFKSDTVSRVDLSHELKLNFLSYDKQVASLSDKIVFESAITSGGSSITILDTSHYDLVLTLDDNKWRVNKIHRTK